ncbi:MGDG synthase family glycosyltransferase [Amycolatopsis benzoatilytica]|uniref:MGDG synthase family glycosyltransferase n=1 Tax=Amycolatopsis benzoatilytica TaxID=346045 RepID=UPI00036BA57A|nr:WS/DGAT domain-containing protein [Amycolatopsis benzoatilytica]
MQRVLIVSANMGQGHNATGRALEEAVRARWPEATVRWVNALERLGPGFEDLFQRIYVANVETTPWLYEFFYRAIWRIGWFAAASRRFVAAWCGRRLARPVEEFAPDLVLSTYPMGTAGLAWLRRHGRLDVPFGAWVSDFAPHPFWVYGAADLTMVMHEVAVAPALRASPSARVGVSAPPVRAVFRAGDQAAARHELELPPDAFVPLVSCGSLGFGEIESTVRELLSADETVVPIAICGRNEALAARLRALGSPRLRVVGWTDRPEVYTLASDVVVTNAGGATALEAFACGRPVLMHRPIAAHGKANARLMAEAGLAVVSWREGSLAPLVRELLESPERFKELVEAVVRHGETAMPLVTALEELVSGPRNPPTQRLRAEDALFAHVATAAVPQQVGAVLVFSPKADGSSVTRADAEHLVAATPGLRTRLLPGGGWWRARWQEDPGRTAATVLTESAAGSGDALTAAMDEFFSEPVTSEHPVRARLVTGLVGGEAALLIALHHAASDGIAVISALVGRARGKDVVEPAPLVRKGRLGERVRGVLEGRAGERVRGVQEGKVGERVRGVQEGSGPLGGRRLRRERSAEPARGAAGAGSTDAATPRGRTAELLGRTATQRGRAAELSRFREGPLAGIRFPQGAFHGRARAGSGDRRRRAAELARGIWALARAGTAPRVRWDNRITSPSRHFARAYLPAAEVRAAARRARVATTNLVLALVAEALHRELGAAAPDRIRVLIPISVRDTGTFRKLGNHTGAASVDLPTGPMPLERRIRETDRMLASQSAAPRAGNAVVRVVGVLPPRLHRLAAKLVYRGTWFSAIASVLPGARSPVVLNGALVRTVYPVLSLAPGVPVAVGILTWADRFTVCVTVPSGQYGRGDRLAAAVVEAFGQL